LPSETTTLTTGPGRSDASASRDRRAVPVLSDLVDHLLQNGDLSSGSSIMALDDRESSSTVARTASTRLASNVGSTPTRLFARRLTRFSSTGARKYRLNPNPIDRLALAGGADGTDH
jgi:hypothetical protein